MDRIAAEPIELTALKLPRDGVKEIVRAWSGEGSLLAALSSASGNSDDIAWSEGDLRRRARRVLLGLLEPELLALPSTERRWLQFLPITVQAERTVRNSPKGAVNWAATVRHFGWPPRRYASRAQRTTVDEVPVATLAWVSARLSDCLSDVASKSRETAQWVEQQQQVIALQNVKTRLVSGEAELQPDRTDLLALARSGYPWRNLAAIASLLIRAERDLEFLAFELLEPDLDVQSRLFHLATYGSVITALRSRGHHIRWNFPLGMSGEGPAVQAASSGGLTWDIWV